MIVLRAHAQSGLKIQSALKRLQRQVNGAQAGTRCRQSIMNVRSFGFALQCSFKHFLRGHVFAAIKFDYATIIKRVGIAGQYAFRSQTRIRNSEIGARARRYFRNLKVFLEQRAKLIACFAEATASKFFVRSLESL